MSNNYITSNDYKKLYKLVLKENVVCFVNYKGNPNIKDIAISEISRDEQTIYSINIGARGITYINAMEIDSLSLEEDFINQCQRVGLEYIEPNKN